MNGISTFISVMRVPVASLCALCHVRTQKVSSLQSRRPAPEPVHSGTLIL